MKRQVDKEQFFTPQHVAEACVALAQSTIDFNAFDVIVEPSAGVGTFLDLLPADRRIGIDIDPQRSDLIAADFLGWRPEANAGRVLVIGNPPFGQRAALAVAFITHACTFADVVAFILPRSFRKYTFQNRVPRTFHLQASLDCDEFVTRDGTPVSVKTVFQVWRKQDALRDLVHPPDKHPHFDMKHAHLSRVSPEQRAALRRDYAFTIPQVGSDFRPRSVDDVTQGSHWFIRPLVDGVQERFTELDFSFLDDMNTAHKSLSKRDIIAAYMTVCGESWEGTTESTSAEPTLW